MWYWRENAVPCPAPAQVLDVTRESAQIGWSRDVPVLSHASRDPTAVPVHGEGRRFSGTMADELTPVPFPTSDERDALVLDFQKAVARLVPAGIMSTQSATRLVRNVQRARKSVEDKRQTLPDLILAILLATEDGTLVSGQHVLKLDGTLAVHIEDCAQALFRAERTTVTAREMRALLRFGEAHFGDVVIACGQRVVFGPDGDRRRAAVLDLPKAYEFVGGRVPSR